MSTKATFQAHTVTLRGAAAAPTKFPLQLGIGYSADIAALVADISKRQLPQCKALREAVASIYNLDDASSEHASVPTRLRAAMHGLRADIRQLLALVLEHCLPAPEVEEAFSATLPSLPPTPGALGANPLAGYEGGIPPVSDRQRRLVEVETVLRSVASDLDIDGAPSWNADSRGGRASGARRTSSSVASGAEASSRAAGNEPNVSTPVAGGSAESGRGDPLLQRMCADFFTVRARTRTGCRCAVHRMLLCCAFLAAALRSSYLHQVILINRKPWGFQLFRRRCLHWNAVVATSAAVNARGAAVHPITKGASCRRSRVRITVVCPILRNAPWTSCQLFNANSGLRGDTRSYR